MGLRHLVPREIGSIMRPTRPGRRCTPVDLVLSGFHEAWHAQWRAQTRRAMPHLCEKGAHYARVSQYLTPTDVEAGGGWRRPRYGLRCPPCVGASDRSKREGLAGRAP